MYLYKRIKILLLLLLPVVAFGQIPVQRAGPGTTVMDSRLKANLNLGTPHYADTTAANVQKGLDSLGNIISTGSNPIQFWIRDSAAGARHWTQVQGSGGGSGLDDVLAVGQDLTTSRTPQIGDNTLTWSNSGSLGNSATFSYSLGSTAFGTSNFFSAGSAGTTQLYTSTASVINGFNNNTTYSELYGSNGGGTIYSRLRAYKDSMIFWSYNGSYRFRNVNASTDTTGNKPIGVTSTGEIVRLSYWPGGTSTGRTLYARNALRARNDSTFTWNGLLDTPTVISGASTYTLKFTAILNGVWFDENPKFNTSSVASQVWTATDGAGNGHWANAAASGAFTRQSHTSGTTVTVGGGNYILKINPSSTLAAVTVTMPASPSDKDIVKIEFGGTLTSGTVVTSLTISPNSGQTIIDNTPPLSATCDNYIEYQYDGTLSIWYRRKP